jgi:hypothetical protein
MEGVDIPGQAILSGSLADHACAGDPAAVTWPGAQKSLRAHAQRVQATTRPWRTKLSGPVLSRKRNALWSTSSTGPSPSLLSRSGSPFGDGDDLDATESVCRAVTASRSSHGVHTAGSGGGRWAWWQCLGRTRTCGA